MLLICFIKPHRLMLKKGCEHLKLEYHRDLTVGFFDSGHRQNTLATAKHCPSNHLELCYTLLLYRQALVIHKCTFERVCVCIIVCVHVNICMYVYYVFVSMYMCVSVNIYTHTHVVIMFYGDFP